MQVKRDVRLMTAAVTCVLWTVATGAAAQHQHTPSPDSRTAASAAAPEMTEHKLKVGKTGDVEFHAETIVGDMRLKPGRYMLQHRVDDAGHFVHFTEVTKGLGVVGTGGGTPVAHPGEVKCRLDPLATKASSTVIFSLMEGETARVTKIVISGENVAHVF